jgi:gas vesicle protein
MATTTPGKSDLEARDRASGRVEPKAEGKHAVARIDKNAQYDLLTAALIGAAVGVSATLLLRGSPKTRRAFDPAIDAARKAGRKGARWARERGEALWDRVPHEDIAESVRGYAESAREAVDRAVDREIRDLRKQLRRQRRRIHL